MPVVDIHLRRNDDCDSQVQNVCDATSEPSIQGHTANAVARSAVYHAAF